MAQEKALQALHSENERLGLYKDAYVQPEQQPEAWMYQEYRDDDQFGWRDEIQFVQPPNDPNYFRNIVPVYTTPPQRTWVGLTDDEMEDTFIQCGGKWNGDFWKIEDADFHPFLRTIEAKLKQKNGYAEEKNT